MAKATANYESVVIFSLQTGEEGITALTEKFKSLISANGTITNVEEWGKRRLAYPINDETEGYYLLVNFTSKPDFPAELDRVLKITDGVLRSLITVKSEVAEAEEAKVEAPAAE